MKKKTYSDIISETVEYYGRTKKFSIDSNRCLYLSPNGNKCALGRYLDFDKHEEFILNQNTSGTDRTILKLLKPTYKHLDDLLFWWFLQNYHDATSNSRRDRGIESLISAKELAIRLDLKVLKQNSYG